MFLVCIAQLMPVLALASISVHAQSTPTIKPPRKDIPTIAKSANGAIVSIVMSDKDAKAVAQGTGFLVSKDGLIVSNYHVIAEGNSAVVKLPDGAFYVVDGILSFDKTRDIAVIKAHGQNFRTLALGDSDRVRVGDEVVAIGNPLSLESTVSTALSVECERLAALINELCLPKTSSGPLRLPQGPCNACYTASLHLVDFKCAASFGEAQGGGGTGRQQGSDSVSVYDFVAVKLHSHTQRTVRRTDSLYANHVTRTEPVGCRHVGDLRWHLEEELK